MNPLQKRLARLRRRLRLFVTFRGLCGLLGVVLLTGAGAGWLDWRWHLPGLVRALLLASGLAGAGLLALRLLVRPLRTPADDLSLALRIEECYPVLNDSLASTVQFLQQPADSDQMGSPSLRRQAMQRALRRAQSCDFNKVINTRGLSLASVAFALGCAAAVPLLVLYPAQAVTALHRLANPFGAPEWTQVALQAPHRVGRGQPFEIRGRLQGIIPEQATVTYYFDGQAPEVQHHKLLPGDESGSARLLARLEPDRVRRTFHFKVEANDFVSPLHQVEVLPPPLLVPLDGRPSPQVQLNYPTYTDLPRLDQPDGVGVIEAPLGTQAILRARTDRPLAPDGAWIEYRPEQALVSLAGFLGPLGTQQPLHSLALHAAAQAALGPVPAQLDETRQVLTLRFLPWVSGAYAVRLRDDTGLEATRWFDLRLLADPAPIVNLERPSASLDNLAVLPTAKITVQVLAEDPVFALRNVYLEYRCRKDDPLRQVPLHDSQIALAAHRLLADLSPGPVKWPLPRLKPNGVALRQRLNLATLRHLDGAALKEGDLITLQACADDFDDVLAFKEPGRSHQVELRIVSAPLLESLVNQAQAQIQQEVLRLREQQREALKKTEAAQQQKRTTSQLRPEDQESLVQAEQLQQQIRARVGTRTEEGLRAEVARVQQTLEDNQLPRSSANERMEILARELDRVAREELEQIESLLTNARKENELSTEPRPPEPNRRAPLDEAVKHQGEVHKTLNDLLALLEPWSQVREVRGEARSILEEQQRLNEKTINLSQDPQIPLGTPANSLPKEQQAELGRSSARQGRQAEQLEQLLTRMDRLAEDKKKQAAEKRGQAADREQQAQAREKEASKPALLEEESRRLQAEAQADRQQAAELQEDARTLDQEAAALEQAARQARTLQGSQAMKLAAGDISDNQLSLAAKRQEAATKAMQEMIQALQEKREEDLDRLLQKLRKVQDELDRLTEEQERLRQRTRDAANLESPAERKQELQRLAREQEKLNQKMQDLLQELTRSQAGRARRELGQAGERMADAQQQLQRGENSEENQEEALDRLDQARRDVQQAREEAEEQLAREKLARVADEIRRLKERQEAAITEAARIHKEVLQNKELKRSLRGSLVSLGRNQKSLAAEATDLAEKKLAGAKVFARLLKKTAEAMTQADEGVQQRLEGADRLDVAAETAADAAIQGRQREAVRWLDQVLRALEPEKGVAQRPMNDGQGGQGTGQAGSPPGDAIPPLAQLKALRALQEEINKRTEEFARKNPDPARYNDQVKAELQSLKGDQREIAEMLNDLTAPAPEGGTP